MSDTSDLIQNEVNGATIDEPIIWFTASSASADAASYSDVESVTTQYAELVYPRRELPPIPLICRSVAANVNEMNGVVSNEPQRISLNTTADATSYSGPGSPAGEPSPAALADYGNEPQNDCELFLNSSPSAVATVVYSGLMSSTREPPPAPAVYDELNKHGYYNTDTDNGLVASGTVCDEPQTGSGISSNISNSAIVSTSYSSSEPSGTPVVYDRVTNPDYYNTNDADEGMASGIICDELQSHTEILLSDRLLSAVL